MEGQSDRKQRITVREAATLLGVHSNTVRNRIKDGSIEAEKVLTERGPTWMIDPDNLTTNTPSSADQQLVGRVPQLPEEALTILAREVVREAGLAHDPERHAEIERDKARFESSKTLLLLYVALLASMGAVTALLPQPEDLYLLHLALYAGLVGLVLTNLAAWLSAGSIGRPAFDRPAGFIWTATTLWFSADVAIFIIFLINNTTPFA